MNTSAESYASARENGLIGARQMQVILYMLDHQQPEGISQGDVGRHFNDASSSFQPRFRELEHSGIILYIGDKVDPVTNRRVKAYQLTGKVPTDKVRARKVATVNDWINDISTPREGQTVTLTLVRSQVEALKALYRRDKSWLL